MKSTVQEITDKLQVFENELFKVSAKQDGEQILFDAEEVARNLGITATTKKNGITYENIRWSRVNDFLPQVAEIKKGDLIPEPLVYKLAFKAQNEVAEKFQDWLAIEVIPSIRKTGTYMTNSVIQEIQNNPEVINFLAEQVAKINAANNEFYDKASEKLETIDKKIEGEYVTPQDLDAINYAIKFKAEKFVDEAGIQITIDSVLVGDIYEQAQASKKEKEQRKYTIGKVKRQILVAVKKHLGMKGNAPNNHIKRKDVDLAIQFIKQVKQRELV